jgi:hypothetical protein
MTSAVLTWQRQLATSGSPTEGDWSVTGIHPTVDKWQFVDELLGATWPSHGLPRGTMGLVNGFIWKNVMESMGFDPMTSWVNPNLDKVPPPMRPCVSCLTRITLV